MAELEANNAQEQPEVGVAATAKEEDPLRGPDNQLEKVRLQRLVRGGEDPLRGSDNQLEKVRL